MRNFFGFEGPFYKYGTLLGDVLILSVLWFICCIPLFTIGASTTAAYYVMTKRLSNKEKYIAGDFFRSFRRNFKTGTLVFLPIAFAYASMSLVLTGTVVLNSAVYVAYLLLFIELTVVTIYIFPLLSRFDMKFAQLFKSAFYMGNRHMLTTIMCALIFLLCYMLIYTTNGLFVFFTPGVYLYFSSHLLIRRFKKYRPEIDADVDYNEILAKRAKEGIENEAIFTDIPEDIMAKRKSDKTKWWNKNKNL